MLLVPRHALHEKVLQREKGVVTLASNQEGSVFLVQIIIAAKPAINQVSEAGFVRPSVNIDFSCSCIWKKVLANCFRCFGGYEKGLFASKQFCQHTVLPDPTPPTCLAPRHDPPEVCPSFGLSTPEVCPSFGLSRCLQLDQVNTIKLRFNIRCPF